VHFWQLTFEEALQIAEETFRHLVSPYEKDFILDLDIEGKPVKPKDAFERYTKELSIVRPPENYQNASVGSSMGVKNDMVSSKASLRSLNKVLSWYRADLHRFTGWSANTTRSYLKASSH